MESVKFIFVLLLVVTILDGFSCVHVSANSGVHCIETEKNALTKFSQGFRNPSQSVLSWRHNENCCNWKGVGCDNRTGHVTILDLHEQFLQGELSTSLLGLPYLRHLDLSHNDFVGARIPEFISTFKNLEYLNLSNTSLRGIIPQHLGNLSRLQFLDLSGGFSLTADNLQWLRHLFSMRTLDLSGVGMSSVENWLNDINLLTSLSKLRLSSCQLATLPKLIPAPLNFTSLQVLDLSLNHFHAPIPSWLFNTSHSIVSLNLERSGIHGSLPSAFDKMYSLRSLDLSENSLQGNLPPSFRKMTSLTFLDLSENSLSGDLPQALPSKLKYLDFSDNNLEGPLARGIAQLRQLLVLQVAGNSFNDSITEHFLNFSNLRVLDLSSTSIILNISDTWMPPFQLDFIGFQSCRQSAQFPQWLQTQKEFSFIDISGASISDEVPDWFWNLSAKVQHMNLSHNYFSGKVPEFTERESLTELDLSFNHFHGPLPHFPLKMTTLILARNFFSGTIAPACESLVMDNSLMYLDLSSNSLSGKLSNCWRYGKNLAVLNLANNDLFGEIPHSIGYLATLRGLQLQNNKLFKNLPSSLMNLEGLKILDVAGNSLSGNIPFWLGEKLQNLMILRLSQNKFDGNIPMQICQLKSLMLLDLSSNALSGPIPKCVDNFLTLAGVEEVPSFVYGPYKEYRKDVMEMLKMRSYYYHMFLMVIDLADNRLSGEVPAEITTLTRLNLLNLSMNNFAGPIPRDIGNMQYLEALDLSWNKLSCSFPPNITELAFLEFLNCSFNSLTGRIPEGRQFDTFESNSYLGNPGLCGFPVSRDCSGHLHEDITHCNKNQEVQDIQHEENNNWLEESSMSISIGIGFNTGFWAFWVTLMLKKSWRYAFMRCLDNMGNKIYVIAAIRFKIIKQQTGW